MASKRARLVVALGVWAAATAGGLYTIAAHGAAPGAAPEAPATLAGTLRTAGRPALVVAAHPACPCTRATFHELERILAHGAGDADVVILFAGGPKPDLVASDLRGKAERMKGVRIVDDPRQELAKSLGAHTSGTVLFYDASGALKFSGGITPSRGHEGDNAGADTIRDLLSRAAATSGPHATPVYGCSLHSKPTP
ncbi:MAG: hypothetical protein U0270_38370 [Labilithrix sp.]